MIKSTAFFSIDQEDVLSMQFGILVLALFLFLFYFFFVLRHWSVQLETRVFL